MVAPNRHLSGCGHQTTTDRHLAAEQVAENRFAVDGTPADCTRLGLLHLAPGTDWVLAGVNDGGNLGVDVFMSGTVAAVREGALLGLPSIAFSQYRRGRTTLDWGQTATMARRVLQTLLQRSPTSRGFWNVNFPDIEPGAEAHLVDCLLDPNPLPVGFRQLEGMFHYEADYSDRRRNPGTDVDACFRGHIALTHIELGQSFDTE